MTTKIENNVIIGEEHLNAQFLYPGPDANKYPVRVIMDGVSVQTLVKHALNDGVIQLRKRIKSKAQALDLANGITFDAMVSSQPKDANVTASMLNVEELSQASAAALLEKLLKTHGHLLEEDPKNGAGEGQD